MLNFAGTTNYPATGYDENLGLKFRSWDIPNMVAGKWGDFRADVGQVISILTKADGNFIGYLLNISFINISLQAAYGFKNRRINLINSYLSKTKKV